MQEFEEELRAEAAANGMRATVARRVDGTPDDCVVIALHDDANTHVRIRPNKVEILASGSTALLYRSPAAKPMTMPAEHGDYKLLAKYLNLGGVEFTLYIAWVTYTLAHAKDASTGFVILVLIGGQGTGKSMISKVTIILIDPSSIGVERLPSNPRDLAIAVQNRHVTVYDNLRALSSSTSDTLCTVATGGAISTRRLYTDDGQHVLSLHGALVLNGIHPFLDQPDLAQRSLPLILRPMRESDRRSEAEMQRELERDLPVIQRGLFDLIAKIFAALPEAKVTNPQRMIDFSRWLAAMEIVHGAPAGVYQDAYAEALNEGQLDTLMENVLGAAVLDLVATFRDDDPEWSGTPAALLQKLSSMQFTSLQRPSRDWPDNPIAMSKRLVALQAAFMSQGIQVTLKRGKDREITIRKLGGAA